MNFFRLTFALILLLNINLHAQSGVSISVSIPTNIASCTSKSFQITVNNTSSNSYANVSIGLMPENSGIADYNSYPLNSNGFYITEDSITLAPGISVFNYTLNFRCNSIPQTASSANTFNDKIQLFDANGNDLLQNAFKLPFTVAFPYLLADPASFTQLNGAKGQTIQRVLTYTNTGTAAFSGEIELETRLDCDSVVIDSMQIAIDTNATFETLMPVDFETSNPDISSFIYNIANNSQSVPVGSKLKIRQFIRIIACLNGCNDRYATADYLFNWGCSSDRCRSASNTARIAKSGAPQLMIRRLLPVPNVTNPLIFWDVNCNGDQRQWKFRVKNTGSATIYNPQILLRSHGGNFYFIDPASISVDTVFLNTNHTPYSVTNFTNTTAGRPACLSQVNDFSGRTWFLDYLAPGEYLDISFNLLFCCPSLDSFGTKHLNLWLLKGTGIDECYNPVYSTSNSDTTIGEYNASFSGDHHISYNYMAGNGHIILQQELEPIVSHLTGARNDTSCSAGDSAEFHVRNTKFEYRDYVNTIPYDYTVLGNLLSNTYNADPNLMVPIGQIKIRIETGTGLMLTKPGGSPLITMTKTLLAGSAVWRADSIVSSNDCSNTNAYDAYFNIDSCPGVSTNGLKGFRDFMNSSWINFGLKACCCAEATGPVPYKVFTWLNAQPISNCTSNCWIPLVKTEKSIHVHCPGCITPGIIVSSSNMVRHPSSYGFKDGNDDGRADGNSVIAIDTSYINNYPVAKNHSMAGDYVVQTVTARFQDGDDSNGGISYATWLGDTCNDPFEYLYMEQVIPHSESNKFDLQACSLLVTINRGGTSYGPLNIDGSDTSCIEKTGSKFFYKLTLSNLQSYGLDSGYAFLPGDVFKVETTFRVTKDPATTSDEVDQNKFESEISNMMYLTGTTQNANAFSNQATAVDIWGDLCTTDSTNCTCTAIPPNAIFYCEPYGSYHYFYNTVMKAQSTMGDYLFPLLRCIKTVSYYYTSSIGGAKAVNVFPYEFRMPPVPAQFNFNQPYPGLILKHKIVSTVIRSYANSDCLPYNEYSFSKVLSPTLTPPFIIPLDTNDATFSAVTGCVYQTGALNFPMVGDEYLYETLSLEFQVDCGYGMDTIPVSSNNLSVTVPILDYENCTNQTLTFQNKIPTPLSFHPAFTPPQNSLDLIFENPDQMPAGSTACFNFRLINPAYATSVQHAFVYIPYSPAYKVVSFKCLGPPCQTVTADSTNDGIIYRLGQLNSPTVADLIFRYETCIEMTDCFEPGIVSIPYKWGWSCGSYPVHIDSAACFTAEDTFTYKQAALNLVTEFDNLDDSLVQCKPTTLGFKITSVEQGGYNNMILNVEVPGGIILDPNTLKLYFNTTSDCYGATSVNTSGFAFVNTGGQNWKLDLAGLSALYGPDFLNRGESVCINFDVLSDCNYLVTGGDVTATLSATSYCGDTITEMPALTDWVMVSSSCSPLATASITHVSSFGGTDGAIDLTINGGKPPYIIFWSSADTTEDLTHKPAGTYTVRIMDSHGCAFEATYEITQPPKTTTCDGFRTQTQGGWGASPHGQNPASYLRSNFSAAFPNDLVIGCSNGHTLTFTSSNDVLNFLPCGGVPAVLTSSVVQPLCMGNVLAGQVTALSLNVGFDLYDAGFGSSSTNLNAMYVRGGGLFHGWSVQEVLDTANLVLGGCDSNYTESEMNDIVSQINENFIDGNVTGSILTCTPPSARVAESKPEMLQFKLHPNPNTGNFNLNIFNGVEEKLLFEVHDLTGRLVYTKQITVKPGNTYDTISLEGFAKGIYSAELSGKESRSIVRFVIQ